MSSEENIVTNTYTFLFDILFSESCSETAWLTPPSLLSNLSPSVSPSSHSGVGWPWTHSASLSSPSRWPVSSPSSGSSTKSAPGCPCASASASSASATSRRWNGTQGDPTWTSDHDETEYLHALYRRECDTALRGARGGLFQLALKTCTDSQPTYFLWH